MKRADELRENPNIGHAYEELETTLKMFVALPPHEIRTVVLQSQSTIKKAEEILRLATS